MRNRFFTIHNLARGALTSIAFSYNLVLFHRTIAVKFMRPLSVKVVTFTKLNDQGFCSLNLLLCEFQSI